MKHSMINNKQYVPPVVVKREGGAVLVMGLVLLTVLTLIGVSSMSSSTLEMKAAANQQQHNIAFQGAQSRLAFTAKEDPVLKPVNYYIAIDVKADPNTWPVQTCNAADGCVDGADWTATATISYLDCQKASGSSLEAGKGVSARIFEIRATALTNAGSAKSVQAGAIRYPVKGCGDET